MFAEADYQGTSLRSPFFFLLLDSFLSFESPLCASPVFAASDAGAASAGAVSLFASVPGAAASLFAGVSVVPPVVLPVAGGFFAAASLPVLPAAAAGATAGVSAGASLGCSVVAGSAAAPSAGGVALSVPPTVSALAVEPDPPAVILATNPVVPPPLPASSDFDPPDNKSAVDRLSDSGSMVGVPFLAAVSISTPGPLLSSAGSFFTRLVRGRGG